MRPQLTPRQQEFFEYFQRATAREGTPPSLRRAARDLGVSHAAVARQLKMLEDKGYVKRDGPYSRTVYILNRTRQSSAFQRWREVPVIGRVAAGRPMYAQQEWEGSIVVDAAVFRGSHLFALHIRGDSMKNAGLLAGDLVICEPRQYARNGEIVVALVNGEEATVKRFFLHDDHVELKPENDRYPSMRYGFGEVLIQGKVVGVQRGPEGIR